MGRINTYEDLALLQESVGIRNTNECPAFGSWHRYPRMVFEFS